MEITKQQNQSLQKLTPETLNKAHRGLKRVEDVLGVQSPGLGALRAAKGPVFVEDFLKLQIATFVDSVNVQTTLSTSQIGLLAEDIIDLYPFLKVADIHLFFKLCRRGYFGEFYNVLSPEKVISWLNSYFDERINTAEKRSLQAHNQAKQLVEKRPEDYRRVIKKNAEKWRQ